MKSIVSPRSVGVSCYQKRWLQSEALASEVRSGVLPYKTASASNACQPVTLEQPL